MLARLAAQLGLGSRYHRVGPATDNELSDWYHGAAAVVAPSIDEGFSLPVIEAQRAGAPVVASDIAVHREVAGGAATLVPVRDAASLREALAVAISRGPGVDAAIDHGRRNVTRYSWAKCADATISVHRSVIG